MCVCVCGGGGCVGGGGGGYCGQKSPPPLNDHKNAPVPPGVLLLAHMQVLDYDIGSIFGGVVMVKLGSILLQLFRNHSPDVQNMVNPRD